VKWKLKLIIRKQLGVMAYWLCDVMVNTIVNQFKFDKTKGCHNTKTPKCHKT